MHGAKDGDDRALGGRLLAALAAYFLLHLALRVLISGSLELDEAEQVLMTQHLAWGYNSQPPLYTWLQAALFQLTGPGVLPLSLLKNALLFSLYLFTFLAAREMAGETRPAVAATVALLFIPQIAWESQRDLTHSVLGTALTAALWYAAARVCRRGSSGDYLLLGLAAGLGVLGKYNVAVALAALLLAWLSLPQFRPRLGDPRILLSLTVFLLVAGGHLGWALSHGSDLLRQAGTFQRAVSPVWRDYLRGSAGLVRAAVLFPAPLLVLFALLFGRPSARPTRDGNPFGLLPARALLAGMALCLAAVLLFRVTNVKDRWLQPILYPLALYLPLLLSPHLDHRRMKRLLAVAAAAGLAVTLLLPARTLFASYRSGRNQLNAPFDTFSEDLRRAGFARGNIAAENRWLGGNLRLRFTGSSVFVPELPPPPPRPGAPWLLVWDASRRTEMPSALRRLCATLPGCRMEGAPAYIAAPGLFADEEMRLGFVSVSGGSGKH